jgi:hypothetical protein
MRRCCPHEPLHGCKVAHITTGHPADEAQGYTINDLAGPGSHFPQPGAESL